MRCIKIKGHPLFTISQPNESHHRSHITTLRWTLLSIFHSKWIRWKLHLLHFTKSFCICSWAIFIGFDFFIEQGKNLFNARVAVNYWKFGNDFINHRYISFKNYRLISILYNYTPNFKTKYKYFSCYHLHKQTFSSECIWN